MGKSHFKADSKRIEQYLSGIDKAQTTREIAEGLGLTYSTIHGTLQLMEVFDTVQKVSRHGNYYFLKGVYSDEKISAMLPPVRVKPPPRRRRSISPRSSKYPIRRNFLEEHLSTQRAQVILGEGPMALAMIGLNQIDVVHEVRRNDVIPVAEVIPKHVDFDLNIGQIEAPRKIAPFATVGQLPKDARKLNRMQTRYLKKQLKGIDGYYRIEGYETAFAYFSALFQGTYGNVFFFATGTQPWERVYRVKVDESIPLEKKKQKKKPVKRPRKKRRWKYDPIIDRFIELGQDLVEIAVKDKNPSYIASQLQKRIEKRELEIIASSVSGFVYLEHMHRKVKETGTPEEAEDL